MTWPLSQDYNEAVQNPATCFADPDLKRGEVTTNALGLPIPRSGNFADVYRLTTPDGKVWALKCFTRKVTGLQERYAAIDGHLHAAALPFTVGFKFHPQGIRIRGQWYPLLQMEWVEGFTLNEFVRANLGKVANLEALFQIWLRLSKRLRDSEIAHADLQHGNVLLVPGTKATKLGLKLIDYDGMWVPELAQQPSGEVGHPAYQHPQRIAQNVYTQQVDRFPHLVIGTALLSLIVGGPELWGQFDNGDNLLFREADLRSPENSVLFKTLWNLGHPTLCHLVGHLAAASWRPLVQTPWLDELMSSPETLALKPALEAQIVARLGVAPRVAAPATSAIETPDVFADLTDLNLEPSARRQPKESSSMLIWLIAGALAFLGLGILGGSILVLLLMDRSGPTSANIVSASSSTIEPTQPTPSKPTTTAASTPAVTTPAAPPTNPGPTMPSPTPPPVAPLPGPAVGFSLTRLWRTPGQVKPGCLEFAANGQLIVTATGDDSEIFRFDAVSGKMQPKLFPSIPKIVALQACSDATILSVSEDNTVIRWDIETGREVRTLRTNKGQAEMIVVSPKSLEAIALDPKIWTVYYYDLESGLRTKNRSQNTKTKLLHASWSPDGRRWIGVDSAGTLAIVDGAKLAEIDNAGKSLKAARFSPNGKQILAFGGPAIALWDAVSLDRLMAMTLPTEITDAIFLADRGQVVFATAEKELFLWGPEQKKPKLLLELPEAITALKLAPTGQALAVACGTGPEASLSLYTINDGTAPRIFESFAKWPHRDDAMGQVLASDALDARVGQVAFAEAGSSILASTSDGKVRIFSAKTLEQSEMIQVEESGLAPLIDCATDATLFTSGRGASIGIWSLTTRTRTATIAGAKGTPGVFSRLRLGPDLQTILAVGETTGVQLGSRTVPLVSLRPCDPEATIEAVLLPDGTQMVVAASNRRVHLYDIAQRQLVRELTLPTPELVTRLTVSSDGKLAAGGGEKGTIWVWEIATGRVLQSSSIFSDPVTGLAFRPDGESVVAVSKGPDFVVWAIGSDPEVKRFLQPSGFESLRVSPNGQYAITGGTDSVVRIWKLP